MTFVEQLQQMTQSIVEQINSIDATSSVSDVIKFEQQINMLAELIASNMKIAQKSTRQTFNCDTNPQYFAQVIRCLMVIEYKTIILATFKLFNQLCFPKSNIPNCMVSNGGMTLLSMRLEEMSSDKNFVVLMNYLNPLFDQHVSCVTKSLITVICAQLTSLKDDVRQTIYNTINLLIIRQTPHYVMMYDLLVKNSLSPDLWEDIIFVVNILNNFYADPSMKETLINNFTLTQKFNIFTEQTSIIEVQELVQEKKVVLERPEIIMNRIDETKQKISILNIASENYLKQKEEIEQTILLKQQEQALLKTEMDSDKSQMLHHQNILNENQRVSDDTLKLNLLSNFSIYQQQFQLTDAAYTQCVQEVNNLKRKLENKKQDISFSKLQKEQQDKILERQNEELEMAQNKKDSRKKIVQKEIPQIKQPEYEFRVRKGAKCSAMLEYMTDFIACMTKAPDSLSYLCEHKYGLPYLFVQMCSRTICPELFAFYQVICDMLLCNMSFRNQFYNVIIGKNDLFDSETIDNNTWIGQGQFSMVSSTHVKYDDKEETSDTLRWLKCENVKLFWLKQDIVTSFHGSGLSQTTSMNYLAYSMMKYLKCGLLEFIIIQARSENTANIARLFFGQYFVRAQQLFNPIQEIIEQKLCEQQQFNNDYCDNSMIKSILNNIFSTMSSVQKELFIDELMVDKLEGAKYSKELVQLNKRKQFELLQQINLNGYLKEIGFENNPILWNWERINDVLQCQQFQIVDQCDVIMVGKIISFLDGTITTKMIQANVAQSMMLSPELSGICKPQKEFKLMQQESYKYNCLFTLLKCEQTSRISQICLQLLNKLLQTPQGLTLIKKSKLSLKLIEILKFIDQQNLDFWKIPTNQEAIFSILCPFTFYEETMEYLKRENVYQYMPQILYNHKFIHATKLFAANCAVSTQYLEKSKGKRCECGNICLVSQNHNDNIRILITSAISSNDVTSRYCIAYHFGVMLKARKFTILHHNVKTKCKCLCKGCLPTQIQFSEMLSQESEHWVLTCLSALINDLQPEVGVLSLTILEEILSPQTADIFDSISFQNWQNYGQFLFAKSVMNKKIAEKFSDEDILKMYEPTKLYQWMHNFEMRLFLCLNRYITTKVKDIMYDKAIPPLIGTSADCYYSKLEYYAFDQTVVPHVTSVGRTALGLKEDTGEYDQQLQKVFYLDRSTDSCILDQTLTNTQIYVRQPSFITLASTNEGCQKILKNKIVESLIKRIQSIADRARISYRGSLLTFGFLMQHQQLFDSVKSDMTIFKQIHQISLFCDNSKTKLIAYYAIIQMIENPVLKQFYRSLGWNFQILKSRDRQGPIGMFTDPVNFNYFNSFTRFSDKFTPEILLQSTQPKVVKTQLKVFSLKNQLHSSLQQYFDPDLQPVSPRENYFNRSEQLINKFPDLSSYNKLHRAVCGYNEQKGVYCLSDKEYQDYVERYKFTKKPDILDQVQEEKSKDFCFAVQSIQKSIPEEHLRFMQFKQKQNYTEYDLAIYEATEFITKDDVERQQGLNLIQQALKQKVKASALLSAYILFFLATNNLNIEIRHMMNQLVKCDGELLEVLDALQQCEDNVEKSGFM
ncbi:Conserved_hypothetical protein [Hexamita inflata]|uniref:Uncharacterized protein n=1 Tax=Hexamita inflata TaxID=28002 RepID=A0AA86QBH9_9EUKA|nr:Conserved hypothetical protein [Hexamita inflata]